MKHGTAIEWTQRPGTKGETWNPVVGCDIVGPGCRICYAMKQARRVELMFEGTTGAPHYRGLTKVVNGKAVWTGKIAMAPDKTVTQPLRWSKPRTVFVNSMGDLFHEKVPDSAIDIIFAVMALTPQHTYIVLTKRDERMRAYFNGPYPDGNGVAARIADATRTFAPTRKELPEPPVITEVPVGPRLESGEPEFGYRRFIHPKAFPLPNVWLGVSAERQQEADARIPNLLQTPAAVRLVSLEPLLGPIDLTRICRLPQKPGSIRAGIHVDVLRGRYCESGVAYTGEWDVNGPVPPESERRTLDWVIVGGESGDDAKPMHPDWARSLRDQCEASGTPFFFKQWGENYPAEFIEYGDGGEVWRTDSGDPGRAWFFDEINKKDVEPVRFVRVGKGKAGSVLDGREHKDFPNVQQKEVAA